MYSNIFFVIEALLQFDYKFVGILIQMNFDIKFHLICLTHSVR